MSPARVVARKGGCVVSTYCFVGFSMIEPMAFPSVMAVKCGVTKKTESQRVTESHRDTQRVTETHRESQKDTQRDTERDPPTHPDHIQARTSKRVTEPRRTHESNTIRK